MHELNDIEKAAITLRAIIIELPKKFNYNEEEIRHFEKEIMDIEHVIEFTDFSEKKGNNYALDIKKARILRRGFKDQNELIEPLLEVVKRMKTFESDLSKAIGEIRRVKKRHAERTYRMRVREDLQEEIAAEI